MSNYTFLLLNLRFESTFWVALIAINRRAIALPKTSGLNQLSGWHVFYKQKEFFETEKKDLSKLERKEGDLNP